MEKLFVAADTAVIAPYGHLQVVYDSGSGNLVELEVLAPPDFGVIGGNWDIRPADQAHNVPSDESGENYGIYELELQDGQSANYVWELLGQVRESLLVFNDDLEYNTAGFEAQNSNSYVRTLLDVIGNTYIWEDAFAGDGMTDFPGYNRNVLKDLASLFPDDGLPLTVAGTLGNDIINGGGDKDDIGGQGGDDTLRGGANDDILSGGPGIDTFLGTPDELDGDTITDLEIGDRIGVSGETVTAESLEDDEAGDTTVTFNTEGGLFGIGADEVSITAEIPTGGSFRLSDETLDDGGSIIDVVLAKIDETMSFADAAAKFGLSDGSKLVEFYLASIFGSAISNVIYTGSESAAFVVSDFKIPGVGIDLEGGILLSSGGFPGSSNTDSGFTVEHGTAGDDDLFEVVTDAFPAAGTTEDAAVLEFDIFVDDPGVEGIRFDIVFGSDEYSEYSNSDFVDVAAVWVDDDRDGDFELDENKALFNGNRNTPLSVIDQNLALNFVDNENGTYAIEWDGFGALAVRPTLQQGMNSIKIAVADTGDQALDSAIYVTNFELLTGGATGDDVFKVVNGAVGQNDLGATETKEEINLADGGGSVSGTLAELNDDVITGFDGLKSLIFEEIEFLRSQLSVLGGSAILEVDSDQDGTVDGTVTLEGEFSDGDFMAVRDDGNTLVTFETFLPLLEERQAVDPDLVNGIINQNFLKGDGTTDFQVTLRDLGFAGYDNVVGVYEIDADGNILDTRILFDDANADKAASTLIEDVEEGHNLGFFIVQDAADWAVTLAESDTLSFVNGSGAAANISDGADISIAVNGSAVDEMVFHGFDENMNSDGLQHALSGVDVGGEAITIGFEDLTGGGDRDYEDVALRVELVDGFAIV